MDLSEVINHTLNNDTSGFHLILALLLDFFIIPLKE